MKTPMNKYLTTAILSIFLAVNVTTAQTWVTTRNISQTNMPAMYKFQTPFAPTIYDTMNIKLFAYNTPDALTGYEVVQQRSCQYSSNPADTLGYVISNMLSNSNATQLTTQNLAPIAGFKGREISIRYNAMINGKTAIAYVRFYYNKSVLLTFLVNGYQNNQSQLVSSKTTFFNSIVFYPEGIN